MSAQSQDKVRPEILLVGYVQKAHSLHGEVIVVPFYPDSEMWTLGLSLVLLPALEPDQRRRDTRDRVPDDGQGTLVTIETLRSTSKQRLIVTLSGVRDRDQAQALAGSRLGRSIVDLPAPEQDEFFVFEAKGWEVVDTSATIIGRVRDVIQGHVDLLEVQPIQGGEPFYVPLVEAFVKDFDRAAGRVVVDPIEGLVP